MPTLDRLIDILKTMDVPEDKFNTGSISFGWLNRNLRINNFDHPDIDEAMRIIREQLRTKTWAPAYGVEL